MKKIFVFLGLLVSLSVWAQFDNDKITVGAERLDQYLPIIADKKVALVVNQTSVIGETHLVDVLLSEGISIKKIFAPEHGFRGAADAGEKVKSSVDSKTGIPLVSLYGKNKKPSVEQLSNIDVVIFDIQDVGARFYTYISTMHYVMEACAEQNKKMIILDRPNPNGHYVGGPILDSNFKSFVGMHKIPIVHGLTVGELACMINEEGWLNGEKNCDVEVITCLGYDHKSFYELPIKPSPNLPDMKSIYLYPHLCFFEGTPLSIGRGTDKPFTIIGHPNSMQAAFEFTPLSKEGAKYPKHENVVCSGENLSTMDYSELQSFKQLNLSYLIKYHNYFKSKIINTEEPYFNENNFIDKLFGTDKIRKMIAEGKTEEQIQEMYFDDLMKYKLTRKKYLLYADFE